MKDSNSKIKPLLSILIPVFNGIEFTRTCLKNLHDLTGPLAEDLKKIQIIVIDDGSTDNTADWINENYPNVKVLKGTGDLWWSGGINKGMKYAFDDAGSEYVLWWNNDIEAEKDYFLNLWKHLEKKNEDTVIGSKIYFKNSKRVWGMGGYFNTKTGKRGMYGFNNENKDEFNTRLSVDWLPGMGSVFSKRIYRQLGLLNDKDFPQYHGDADYTLRAKLAGFSIVVYPDLVIYNDKSNSSLTHNNSWKGLFASLNSIRSNYDIKKDIIFYRKYSTSPIAWLNLMEKYIIYFGGFLKWKFLGIFGKKKHELAT